MTDPTAGTGVPDDRFGPETPGPDATPEQESFVTGLLGSLRTDDPEMADHVAARIDGVLAELRRTESVAPATSAAAGAAAALTGSDEDDATAAGPAVGPVGPVGTDATVLPMPAERRASGTTRTFRWVAGAAAAVVVLGAGAAVIRGTGSTSGSSSTALSAGDATTGAGEGAVPIRSSGTDYRSQRLADQAQTLVADSAKNGAAAPEVAPSEAPSTASAAGGTPNALSLLSTSTLAACLEQLTGAPGARPVAVDQGTFEGKPADVVVLPSPDDPRRLEVWVIGPGCTRENVELYEYRTIDDPGTSPAPATTSSP